MSKRSASSNSTYGVSEDIWASMRPYRVPYEEPKGSDARMVAAYKKKHASDIPGALSDLAIVQKGEYCSKCLLHNKVCRTFAENLKKVEEAADVLNPMNMNTQPAVEEKEKREFKAERGAEGGVESKEN